MDYRISARREVFGELDRRMEANHARLLTREYSVEYMREMDKSDWPGDYRGRTLLALACQYEMLRRDGDNLSEIIEDTLNVLSDKGYLGAEVRHGATDEQQLAGHSWFLRALIAAERITGDARVRAALERMFERLFLASSAAFEEYPIKRAAAIEAGGPIGTVQGDVQDGWRLSSDVGCVFIALDGLSDYYACTREGGLRRLA